MAEGDRYKAGSVRLHLQCNEACVIDEDLPQYSSHYEPYNDNRLAPETGVVYLPHQCDAWVIGGADEIKSLIVDLLDALDHLTDDEASVATRTDILRRVCANLGITHGTLTL